MMSSQLGIALAMALVLVLAGACDNSTTPFDPNGGKPVAVELASDTSGWSALPPDTTLDVAVKLTDAYRAPVADRLVTFATGTSGTVDRDSVRSGADGIARAEWTLGPDTTTYRLTSRVPGVSLSFQPYGNEGLGLTLSAVVK